MHNNNSTLFAILEAKFVYINKGQMKLTSRDPIAAAVVTPCDAALSQM
jgi:hypothetical protein